MITYNSSKFLNDAIDSVLKLDYGNFELVISDDNSTDNSWEIINSYADKRIVTSRNEKNIGEYNNRNRAIELAKGDYILFVDGDDIMYSYGLKYISWFANKYPNCAMVICRGWDERVIYPYEISPEQFFRFEYLDNGMTTLSFINILFKRTALIDVGCFDDLSIKMGDTYVQYKLGLKYNSIITLGGVGWWRRNSGQASEKLLNDQFAFFQDANKITIPFLEYPLLNITETERIDARVNIYGNYLRFLIRQTLKLNIKSVISLFQQHPISKKYLKYALVKPRKGYYNNYSGSNPLRN